MVNLPLHDQLCDVLGSPYCFFSPPASIQLPYPCIIYNCTNDMDIFADNVRYHSSKRYTVTVIDEDPDSKIPERLKDKFLYCSSDRNFAVEGLNHFVYSLYYNGPRIKEEKENE